jgi:hypothetical protein
MRNMVLFFIVLGVLLLAAAFILCILVFHPNTTSIILGLTVPFIIFLLIRKKLINALKMDESGLDDDKKNESLGKINLDKPVSADIRLSNDPPVTVTQNRDKLKDFFKKKSSKPSDELKQNDFSFLALKDKHPHFHQQQATLLYKLYSGDIISKDYSIPYPEPFYVFTIKVVGNFLKELFWIK